MTSNEPAPAILVIFGITGDLSQRYLLPALYNLLKKQGLHPDTKILGITRGDTSAQELLDRVEICISETDKVCDPLTLKLLHERTEMFQMDLDNGEDYAKLAKKLNSIEDQAGICMDRLYYLSIPPTAYKPVITNMGLQSLNKSCQHDVAETRLMVEKPFGFDLRSATELLEETSKHFDENQTFRIDHYMAKPKVQEIINLRLQKPEMAKVWDNRQIQSIQISAKEKIGIEGRAVFYDNMGALRDFIQSHLIQTLGVVIMDQPDPVNSATIHANKEMALGKIVPIQENEVLLNTVRGQYKGYRQEAGNPNSTTETYAQINLTSSDEKWQNVQIILLTGKDLDERKTEVKINFKDPLPDGSNAMIIRIDDSANAYEKVFSDAIAGDQSLFASKSEVLSSWQIIEAVLQAWAKNDDHLLIYEKGSAGPASAK